MIKTEAQGGGATNKKMMLKSPKAPHQPYVPGGVNFVYDPSLGKIRDDCKCPKFDGYFSQSQVHTNENDGEPSNDKVCKISRGSKLVP